MLRTSIPTILVSVLLSACGELGNGVFAHESRVVPSFDQLTNASAANVYLDVSGASSAGESVQLSISGDENLIDEISVSVVDGRLTVQTDGALWPDEELKIIATVAALSDVENTGSGDVEILGVRDQTIALVVSGSGTLRLSGQLEQVLARDSGSGDIELSGRADIVDFGVSGSGDIEAFRFDVARGDASSSGSGRVEICVTERLDATVSGSGDVVYDCDPDIVDRTDSGSGRIRAR